jgi:hypothetical protein
LEHVLLFGPRYCFNHLRPFRQAEPGHTKISSANRLPVRGGMHSCWEKIAIRCVKVHTGAGKKGSSRVPCRRHGCDQNCLPVRGGMHSCWEKIAIRCVKAHTGAGKKGSSRVPCRRHGCDQEDDTEPSAVSLAGDTAVTNRFN